MINPQHFTDKSVKIGFKIIPDSHNVNHANSILFNIPIYPDFGIETRYINKDLRELATIYARLIIQYKFKYLIIISASFYKIIGNDQRSDEVELLNIYSFEHSS